MLSTSFVTGSVLANDSDPDGDPLSVTAVDTSATVGDVTDNGDGTFTYDPKRPVSMTSPPARRRRDSFSYTVSDGQGGTSTASVTITIEGRAPGNQLPIAADDQGDGFFDGCFDELS